MEEGRLQSGNLATRIMFNGVEVIVADKKSDPNLRFILTPTEKKSITTLPPFSVRDNAKLVVHTGESVSPTNVQPSATSYYKSLLNDNLVQPNFVTKTCLTTFTYLTTLLDRVSGSTTIKSHEQIVRNIATEERHGQLGAIKASVTPLVDATMSSSVTITATPKLNVGVFYTTYTYLNRIVDDSIPTPNTIELTSLNTITNTVTAGQPGFQLQPSEILTKGNTQQVTPHINTNTYYHELTGASEPATLTQVVITEWNPQPELLTKMDEDINGEAIKPTDVQKTYFVSQTQNTNKQEDFEVSPSIEYVENDESDNSISEQDQSVEAQEESLVTASPVDDTKKKIIKKKKNPLKTGVADSANAPGFNFNALQPVFSALGGLLQNNFRLPTLPVPTLSLPVASPVDNFVENQQQLHYEHFLRQQQQQLRNKYGSKIPAEGHTTPIQHSNKPIYIPVTAQNNKGVTPLENHHDITVAESQHGISFPYQSSTLPAPVLSEIKTGQQLPLLPHSEALTGFPPRPPTILHQQIPEQSTNIEVIHGKTPTKSSETGGPFPINSDSVGIPISPGEIITTNADVIIGRPSGHGPRIPLGNPPDYGHIGGMQPPPPPTLQQQTVDSTGASSHKKIEQYIGPPPPIPISTDFPNTIQHRPFDKSPIHSKEKFVAEKILPATSFKIHDQYQLENGQHLNVPISANQNVKQLNTGIETQFGAATNHKLINVNSNLSVGKEQINNNNFNVNRHIEQKPQMKVKTDYYLGPPPPLPINVDNPHMFNGQNQYSQVIYQDKFIGGQPQNLQNSQLHQLNEDHKRIPSSNGIQYINDEKKVIDTIQRVPEIFSADLPPTLLYQGNGVRPTNQINIHVPANDKVASIAVTPSVQLSVDSNDKLPHKLGHYEDVPPSPYHPPSIPNVPYDPESRPMPISQTTIINGKPQATNDIIEINLNTNVQSHEINLNAPPLKFKKYNHDGSEDNHDQHIIQSGNYESRPHEINPLTGSHSQFNERPVHHRPVESNFNRLSHHHHHLHQQQYNRPIESYHIGQQSHIQTVQQKPNIQAGLQRPIIQINPQRQITPPVIQRPNIQLVSQRPNIEPVPQRPKNPSVPPRINVEIISQKPTNQVVPQRPIEIHYDRPNYYNYQPHNSKPVDVTPIKNQQLSTSVIPLQHHSNEVVQSNLLSEINQMATNNQISIIDGEDNISSASNQGHDEDAISTFNIHVVDDAETTSTSHSTSTMKIELSNTIPSSSSNSPIEYNVQTEANSLGNSIDFNIGDLKLQPPQVSNTNFHTKHNYTGPLNKHQVRPSQLISTQIDGMIAPRPPSRGSGHYRQPPSRIRPNQPQASYNSYKVKPSSQQNYVPTISHSMPIDVRPVNNQQFGSQTEQPFNPKLIVKPLTQGTKDRSAPSITSENLKLNASQKSNKPKYPDYNVDIAEINLNLGEKITTMRTIPTRRSTTTRVTTTQDREFTKSTVKHYSTGGNQIDDITGMIPPPISSAKPALNEFTNIVGMNPPPVPLNTSLIPSITLSSTPRNDQKLTTDVPKQNYNRPPLRPVDTIQQQQQRFNNDKYKIFQRQPVTNSIPTSGTSTPPRIIPISTEITKYTTEPTTTSTTTNLEENIVIETPTTIPSNNVGIRNRYPGYGKYGEIQRERFNTTEQTVIKDSITTSKPSRRRIIVSTRRTPLQTSQIQIEDNLASSVPYHRPSAQATTPKLIILPTKYVTNTKTLTVTTTKTTVIHNQVHPSLSSTKTSTIVLTLTKTQLSTIYETQTIQNNIDPTSTVKILSSSTQIPEIFEEPLDVQDDGENQSSENHQNHRYGLQDNNGSIFVVMTDRKNSNILNFLQPVHVDEIGYGDNGAIDYITESESDNELPLRDDLPPHQPSQQNILLGGILIESSVPSPVPIGDKATPFLQAVSTIEENVISSATKPHPTTSIQPTITTKPAVTLIAAIGGNSGSVKHESISQPLCLPNCKTRILNEICGTEGRCICPPGFSRLFPDRPCKPIYTYMIDLILDRYNNLRLTDEKFLNSSVAMEQLKKQVTHGIERMIMQTELRDSYLNCDVVNLTAVPNSIDEESEDPVIENSGIAARFYLQLSENVPDTHLMNVFKRYLRQNNYNVGVGTDLYTATTLLDQLNVTDFNECNNSTFNDCSKDAACFNLYGTYTCSCTSGFIDVSPNTRSYPGRECTSALRGCTKCNFHGLCKNERCECFKWYGGPTCGINLKVLLFGLILVGLIILALFIFYLVMTCNRKKRAARAQLRRQQCLIAATTAIPAQRQFSKRFAARKTHEDRHSVVSVESTASGSNEFLCSRDDNALIARPKAKPEKRPTKMAPPPPPSQTPPAIPPGGNGVHSVMIPRAKYHHQNAMAASGANQAQRHYYDQQSLGSTTATTEAKLLSYLDVSAEKTLETIADQVKKEQKKISVTNYHGAQNSSSTGALISAGYEVSATVGTNGVTSGGNKPIQPTVGSQYIENNGANFDDEDDDDDISGGDWLDIMVGQGAIKKEMPTNTMSEARSYAETTVRPVQTTFRGYELDDTRTMTMTTLPNDEANTMNERDVGSTFLLPHTHLYKPDRGGSDISGFDSL